MPTRRAFTFIIIAFMLYFFANQTQVGWLYVMSALAGGITVGAWLLNRRALDGLTLKREASATEIHEGDELSFTLTITAKKNLALIRLIEQCAFAVDPTPLKLFIPSLAPHQTAHFAYNLVADRRGVHRFAPMPLASRAPFGLFERKSKIDSPTSLVIYPEIKKLRRLSLLDRQPAATLITPRSGLGTEVIGIRPYRVGDSPRHIHWRSTARTSHLISKEFADESNPGLTLILDVGKHQLPITNYQSKHTPFEYAVKIAASVGDYALRRNFPLHLLADESALATPNGALNRFALLEYLARIQPNGTQPLAQVIQQRHWQTYTVLILPQPNSLALESISALHQHTQLLVIVLDPATFPNYQLPTTISSSFVSQLHALNIAATLIPFTPHWENLLEATPESLIVNHQYVLRNT